jgi:hypothetical protein
MYDRMNLPVERRILENKVLDLFQDIQDEEMHLIDLAFNNGFDDGLASAREEFADIQGSIKAMATSMMDFAKSLSQKGV